MEDAHKRSVADAEVICYIQHGTDSKLSECLRNLEFVAVCNKLEFDLAVGEGN